MPLFGWIRDLFGIQKDMYETKKTRLEIERLERVERLEQEVRDALITRATVDDVKKYDPKITRIESNIKKERERDEIDYRHGGPTPIGKGLWLLIKIWVVGVGILVTALMVIVMLITIYKFLVG